jgi:hypothetical protein
VKWIFRQTHDAWVMEAGCDALNVDDVDYNSVWEVHCSMPSFAHESKCRSVFIVGQNNLVDIE